MRKVLKRIFFLLMAAVLVILCVRFGPGLYALFTGRSTIQFQSTRLTEELQKANEMVVQKWEITGVENVQKDVNFVLFTGTTQNISIPYTFTMEYKVNLSQAVVEARDGKLLVRIPSPYGANPKLTVNEEKVSKSDFFDPVTAEQYSEYKKQLEDKLFAEGCQSEENLDAAWEHTVENITSLYRAILEDGTTLTELVVIRDDTGSAAQ